MRIKEDTKSAIHFDHPSLRACSHMMRLLVFGPLLAGQTVMAGTFYDGGVAVTINGNVSASASPSWTSESISPGVNVGVLQPGGVQIATGYKEWEKLGGNSNSIYNYSNIGDASISAEVKVGNGSATLELFAEVSTSTSFGSDDYSGLNISNSTTGSAQAYGNMTVTFPDPIPYSVRVTTLNARSGPEVGDRYSEGSGGYVTKAEIQSVDAGSSVTAPAGVPGQFSGSDFASNGALVSLTVLYGSGATQNTATPPTGPATDTPGANTVIQSTVGNGSPPVTYKTGSTESFDDVPAGRWYDPVLSYGFVYEATGETQFTEVINLPIGFSGAFTIWAEGRFLGHYRAGDFFRFSDLLGHDVSSFAVLGITPETEGAVVEAFPIQLGFNADTGSFRQHALDATTLQAPGANPLVISGLPNGRIELSWADALTGVLEQSATLGPESWSVALDNGEPLAAGAVRLTLEPATEARFFRLRTDPPAP